MNADPEFAAVSTGLAEPLNGIVAVVMGQFMLSCGNKISLVGQRFWEQATLC
jgi:hypothetical protein